MRFFLTLDEDGDVSFSPIREMDKLSPKVSYLKVPLPLSVIQVIQSRMHERGILGFWSKDGNYDRTKAKLLRVLNDQDWGVAELTWEESFVTSNLQMIHSIDTADPKYQAFDQLVHGKQITSGDLRVLARELKIEEGTIIEFAQANVEWKKAKWIPAVLPQGSGWQCQRCGEKDVEEWPSYYGRAASCRSCNTLGSSTSLDVLYRDYRPLHDVPRDVNFQPHWRFTEAQRLASEQVLEFINDSSRSKALLWAACGAGKTEVCFPAAAWALQQGKSVLFAAPRQDVINDVAPRLKRDFPGFPIQVLTGASSIRFQNGGLVLATTHQVLRFWQAFEVIFLDEMDAFPYQGSRALEWGLIHALCPDGKLLFLTATPSSKGLKEVHRGNMRLIQLPARHHRHPLPVPTIERYRHTLDPWENPQLDKVLFKKLRQEGPILVFVPKISWIEPWIHQFRQFFPEWQIDGSYSSDPGRSVKFEKLRRSEFDLFVSTTILERGITLARIQVVVLGADHSIFDERALVQMGGRVGRTQENPGGRVVFMAHLETPAMKIAIGWIEKQNRLALEQGLID